MKNLSSRLRRIIYLAASLILVVVITNPSTLFFLPASAKQSLGQVWTSLFGNVNEITNTLHVNWISIFQIVVIVLFMMLVDNAVHLVLEKIKPKTGKSQSICSMIDSYCVYAVVLVGLVWCLSAIGINLSTIFASLGIVALIMLLQFSNAPKLI